MEDITNDFDPLKLATEEIIIFKKYNLEAEKWIFGIKTFEAVLALNLTLNATKQDSDSNTNQCNLFLGIPLEVDPSANPWTIKLIKKTFLD